MSLDLDTCYRALTARDARFDGLFFVAVATTGIYCRPVCTARTPRRDRCAFYPSAAEAEHAGFRACFRCRPELAPGLASVDSVPRLVAAAMARIDEGYLNEHSVADLAAELGVADRHLRRAVQSVLGVAPGELAQSRRLALAKQLLHDTDLSLARVALASGFGSIRRFNAAFLATFGQAPSTLRRSRTGTPAPGLVLRLGYRAPLDWRRLLGFLRARAIPGIEEVGDDVYRRAVRIGDASGWVTVTDEPARASLRVACDASLAGATMAVAARLRALFDLDARPDVIAAALASDPALAPRVRARPGLRVPGAFDPFEVSVRAILGQQVSVKAASTLAERLVTRYGQTDDGVRFPPAALLAATAPGELAAGVGMPETRARALIALASAVAGGALRLERPAEVDAVVAALDALPGIGPWTAHYVAMRALGWPDAFPTGDLVIRRALGGVTAGDADRRAEAWRPWRAYAVLHLWTADAEGDAP